MELLGSGSMGRVYRAHHTGLEKDVAIKVLRDSALPDPDRSVRFAREARAASRLSHPNSVAILDFGEDGQDRLLYIAMELIEGEDLQVVIDRGTLLGVDRLCHIMIQVLAAVAAAHDAEIIHRDMKPSNVVLVKQRDDDGEMVEVVKVCDFGVAKLQDARDTLDGSRSQKVVGTPLYMSPEQASGERLDVRTDIYSCGVIMYEMLTGQPPFSAETPMGVLMKHVSETPVAPSVLVPGVPPELEALILWALEKDRTKRPQSARALRSALRDYLSGAPLRVPELSRYGIEVGAEAPERSRTRAEPSTRESPILPAPPLPPVTIARTEPLDPAPAADALVGDLELSAAAPAERSGARSPGAGSPRDPRSSASEDEAPSHNDELPMPVRELVGAVEPPREGPARPPTSDAEPTAEIFGDRFFFDPHPSGRVTLGTDEAGFPAPLPRALTEPFEHESDLASPPMDAEAQLLERYGLAPTRRPPARGFWIDGAGDRPFGPLTWFELVRAIRAEAATGGIGEIAIRVERDEEPIAATRFAELTGVETLLWRDLPEPTELALSGDLEQHSLTWLLGEVARRGSDGRLDLEVRAPPHRHARFEILLAAGEPVSVRTNEPHLQLTSLLVAKALVDEGDLPDLVRSALADASSLEAALRRQAGIDIEKYHVAITKERLRHLMRWPMGRYQLDAGAKVQASAQGVSPMAEPLVSVLPDLVYRSLPKDRLEGALRPLRGRRLVPAADATARLDRLRLAPTQHEVAEKLLSGGSLKKLLPADGKGRKAYTTMAYVLLELGLMIPAPSEER